MELNLKDANYNHFAQILRNNPDVLENVRKSYAEKYEEEFEKNFKSLKFEWMPSGSVKDVKIDFKKMDSETKKSIIDSEMEKKKINLKYLASDMDALIQLLVDSYLINIYRKSDRPEELADYLMDNLKDEDLYVNTDTWEVYKKEIKKIDTLL